MTIEGARVEENGPLVSMPAWLTLIRRGSDDTDWKKPRTPEEEMDHP
jgi:hypothetical protein